MRVSIPGMPGVYYDTDAESTALTVAMSAASRKAPKPQRYALQLLPHLWSFDVDLTEVPDDHPLQYLHPEGARSLEELTRPGAGPNVGRQVDLLVQFAWAVNDEVENAAERVVGSGDDVAREQLEAAAETVVIDIEEGDSGLDEGSALSEEVEFSSEDDAADDGPGEFARQDDADGFEIEVESGELDLDETDDPDGGDDPDELGLEDESDDETDALDDETDDFDRQNDADGFDDESDEAFDAEDGDET